MLIDFAKARARICPVAYVVPEADMVVDIELTPQLTLAEIATRVADQIGARGLLQELS